jgi:hypothetical protein
MREVITYVAYNGEPFDNREACEEYEGHIYDMITSISEKYSFFDEDMNILLPPNSSPDIDDWIKFFNDALNRSSIVYRDENLTNEEDLFIRREFGCCFENEDFNNEIGWFRWDENGIEWVKMGE